MEKSKDIRNFIDNIKGREVNENDFITLNEIFGEFGSIPLYFNCGLNNTASFNPNFYRINIDLNRVDKWANDITQTASLIFDIDDLELAKAYFIVQMYRHELEHVNEYLIATDQKAVDYEFLKQVYRDVFDFLIIKERKGRFSLLSTIKDSRKLSLYKKNAYNYILERNADIESYDYLSKVAMDSGDSSIKQLMISCRNTSMLIGYTEDESGCIKKTYEGLHMESKYGSLYFPSLSMMDKVRYGLELEGEERKTLIKTFKTSIYFK